jgi:putative protein-disulfide isomerase
MAPLLIYCYDAYCGWCYGFSPVIRKLFDRYKSSLDFEVLSGGMIINEQPVHISRTAQYIQNAYKRVEELAGVKFGADWLWHIFNPEKSDWYPDSLHPARALCVIKELRPEIQIPFCADMQYAYHMEGRDLTDNESYRHLLDNYGIPQDEFFKRVANESSRDAALHEFSLIKQLQVTGFPCVLMQQDESKFYLLARGYTDYDTLEQRIEKVLEEINQNH